MSDLFFKYLIDLLFKKNPKLKVCRETVCLQQNSIFQLVPLCAQKNYSGLKKFSKKIKKSKKQSKFFFTSLHTFF